MKDKLKTAGKILSITAALMCGFLLYTFIFTMSLGQVNHGNVIGSICCIGVILVVLLYPIMKRIRRLHILANAAGVLLGCFWAYCTVISLFIASEMMTGEEKAAAASTAGGGTVQTVIVLGCKTIDGYPSTMLELRLRKAMEYMESHPGTVCIVTGGQGSDEIEPEAVSMRRYLISNGISEDRIYTEERSENTAENIAYSKDIIERESLPRTVVVVSECYHIYRGVRQAKLAGLDASGIYPDPSPVIMTMPSYWVREIFAVTRDLLV